MIEKMHMSAILLFAAGLWGCMLLLEGVAVTPVYFRPYSTVLGAVMMLLAAFDLWLWRLPILQGWLVKRPVLNGTWRAEIRSNWIDPATGHKIDPIAGFMVARQTFSRLALRLITPESQSELLGAEITRSGDGSYYVFGVYRNEPRMSVRYRSDIHYGGLALQVAGRPPTRAEGHYWTDRETAGELLLTDHRPKHADDITSARALYSP
jgi:hypothetical protein